MGGYFPFRTTRYRPVPFCLQQPLPSTRIGPETHLTDIGTDEGRTRFRDDMAGQGFDSTPFVCAEYGKLGMLVSVPKHLAHPCPVLLEEGSVLSSFTLEDSNKGSSAQAYKD